MPLDNLGDLLDDTESLSFETAPAPQEPDDTDSLSYKIFLDENTDAGCTLNEDAPVSFFEGESAHGLGWDIPEGEDGSDVDDATAVIYCRSRTKHTPQADMTGLECLVKATDEVLSVRFDFPASNPLPPGQWEFFAQVSLNGRVDMTSGILVIVEGMGL